jgi:hypothetical protein
MGGAKRIPYIVNAKEKNLTFGESSAMGACPAVLIIIFGGVKSGFIIS